MVRIVYLLSLPSRRLPVECAFSPDGLFEARFRPGNTPNLREGEQLPNSVNNHTRFAGIRQPHPDGPGCDAPAGAGL